MKGFEEFMDDVVKNKIADECETDLEWEERYPVVKRYLKDDDEMEKIRKKIKEEEIHNTANKEVQKNGRTNN